MDKEERLKKLKERKLKREYCQEVIIFYGGGGAITFECSKEEGHEGLHYNSGTNMNGEEWEISWKSKEK